MDKKAMFKIGYGLYVLTASFDGRDNGCIINTAQQAASVPNTLTIAVNKENLTHDMVMKSGVFNVSILDNTVPFEVFQHFGLQSGKNVSKFVGDNMIRGENGVIYIPTYTNAYLGGKVRGTVDLGSHTLFIADVTEGEVLSNNPSVTYAEYHDRIKPKPKPKEEKKKGWRCTVCGYVYEGEELPPDFVCPLCKHGAEDFERIV